ncbi:MAG: hypothetical protein MJ197_10375 [Bacteroidales bacterium]|nr:hypothetical protein [Bacteroidales bacterium]
MIEFNKIRSTKEIFADYFVFMKSEGVQYCMLLALFVLPFSFVGSFFLEKSGYMNLLQGATTFSYSNLFLALLFSFVAKFLGIAVSCGYIHNYIQGQPSTFETIKTYLSEVWKVALLSVVFMVILEFVGLLLFIIPAILLLPALSMITYDVLFAKQFIKNSFFRCLNLSQTNTIQSYGVVFLCYIGVYVFSILLAILLPFNNTVLNVVQSAIVTVISETTMIPFVLLYYSLANQNLQS